MGRKAGEAGEGQGNSVPTRVTGTHAGLLPQPSLIVSTAGVRLLPFTMELNTLLAQQSETQKRDLTGVGRASAVAASGAAHIGLGFEGAEGDPVDWSCCWLAEIP